MLGIFDFFKANDKKADESYFMNENKKIVMEMEKVNIKLLDFE